LPGAGVSVLKLDSTIVSAVISDSIGNFSVRVSTPGTYLVKMTFIGYSDLYVRKEIGTENVSLGSQTLQERSTSLGEVNVEEKLSPVQAIGDTTQYNADAYKTSRDATTEDLVQKMPGITVQDGKVQAQGEDVKKVLIDGKPFLGEDPNAALKNLPAEVVDKIQVYDKKSDQSEFTGFDDGNTTKTLNIVTRPQFRNGTFGRVFAGAGTDDRWKAGLSINSFKDKRKFTILGNSNNINDQNFATEDLLGVVGTNASVRGRGRGPRGGGGRWQPNDAGNFLVDSRNGIANTNSAGLNYSNQFRKSEVTLSYFFNRSETRSNTDLYRQYFNTESGGLTYSENNSSYNENTNHRVNLKVDTKFDSLNSLLIQPRFSFQRNNSASLVQGINTDDTGLLSIATSDYGSDQKAISFNTPLLYRHSFLKKGRTFSVNLNTSYNESEGDNDLLSLTLYETDTIPSDTMNQVSDPATNDWKNSADITYTEPLGKDGQISISYDGTLNYGSSDKLTYSYSPADELYNVLDTSISIKFNSTYTAHRPGVRYRLNKEKWSMMLGISHQWSMLDNEQTFPQTYTTERSFTSVLPHVMFNYRFTPKKTFRVYYRSYNNSPSVSQLQDVVDNTNPLLLTTGNPGLTQDWSNFVHMRYSAVNADKGTNFFGFVGMSFTRDYIGNSTFIASGDTTIDGIELASGSQLSRPININGYYSIRSFGNYSFPIKFFKSNLSLNANASVTRIPSMINEEVNFSSSISSGLGVTLSSNISDKFDFLVYANGSYSDVRNTIETSSNSNSYSLLTKFRIQAQPWKGLVFQTEISNQNNSGLSAGYNTNYTIWNAAIGYKFLKDQLAELRLSVTDILKENKSITRNTTDTYIEDVQSNVLQQYFMLTFTYNLKYFKTSDSN